MIPESRQNGQLNQTWEEQDMLSFPEEVIPDLCFEWQIRVT